MQHGPLAAPLRAFLSCMVAFLAACSQPRARFEEFGPVRGTVVSLTGTNILMVTDKRIVATYSSDTVFVRADSSTPTRRRGLRVRLVDLRPGDRIAVWFPGAVMESRPPQIGALRIEIE